MDKKKSFSLKSKQKYLYLIYKITQQKIAGNKPSAEMLKEAWELGSQVDIPEEELINIGLVNVNRTNNC